MADLEALAGPDLLEMLEDPAVQGLVTALADHSPYLWNLIESDPDRLGTILGDRPGDRLESILAQLDEIGDDEAEIMARLRRTRQFVALLVALADLGGVWTLEDAVQALSRAADALIGAAMRFLLRQAYDAKKLVMPDVDRLESGCGVAILGLGKLGGRELNYSSDVDLIVVFDPGAPAVADRDGAKTLFVRIVRDLVRLLQQPTKDGYVLRVDLRLRPDPGSTAVAVGLDRAHDYYETYGQTWERAALIKARPVAGDRELGRAFIEGLTPFVWRRYFDYASLADIHVMKRRIHAAKGGDEIAVLGHDVKIGRGGIRDIEFFVQAQQLVFGGKQPALRGTRTLPMLRQLRLDGWIGARAVTDLTRAYEFLRRTEHRLQMLRDEQTHRLPTTPDDLERFARFCGFVSAARFTAVATAHMQRVARHYARLFEQADGAEDHVGLVFTGVDDDPETITALDAFGYASAALIATTVRAWLAGGRPAVQSPRARATLIGLVPKLLVACARTADPDAAIVVFDRMLERMPAAAELFTILTSNAALLGLFADVLGSAPVLAEAVAARPHLLDAAIDPRAEARFDDDAAANHAAMVLSGASTTEEGLDKARDHKQEEHFLIGVKLLSGDLAPDAAGLAYSALAVGLIRTGLDRLRLAFETEHGRIAGSALAVVAMGRLGSREMTATSDLDLVIVYDFDPDRPESDGTKPLHAAVYFARLTQRLVSHLTVATRRGGLYEVDMRLRPSGGQGPLATKFSAFKAYQRTTAQTWEKMALTRARVIAGDRVFGDRLTDEIDAILREAATDRTRQDVADMRALVEREKPAKGLWDLKALPGGLVDIEFMAQCLILQGVGAGEGRAGHATRAALERAAASGAINPDVAINLVAAHWLFTGAMQIQRLALPEQATPEDAGDMVKRRLASATGRASFERLKKDVADTRRYVEQAALAFFGSA